MILDDPPRRSCRGHGPGRPSWSWPPSSRQWTPWPRQPGPVRRRPAPATGRRPTGPRPTGIRPSPGRDRGLRPGRVGSRPLPDRRPLLPLTSGIAGTPPVNVPVASTTDFGTWSPVTDALPVLPDWAVPGYTWAPDLHQFGSHLRALLHRHGAGTRRRPWSASGTPSGPPPTARSAPSQDAVHLPARPGRFDRPPGVHRRPAAPTGCCGSPTRTSAGRPPPPSCGRSG